MSQQQILVVEHEENTIKLLEDMLGQYYRVLYLSHGERAIKMIDQAEVAFTIVSQWLPDIDGLELLKKLRKKFPALPIIFIAEFPTNELIIDAFRSGANDFIKKPICESDFLERIKKLEDRFQLNLNIFKQSEKKDQNQSNLQCSPLRSNENSIKKIAGAIIPYFKKSLKKMKNFKYTKIKNNSIYAPQNKDQSHVGNSEIINIKNFPSKKIEVSGILQLNFLGEFKVSLNGTQIVEWPGKKARELFAYLGYYHKRKINRDYLIEKFWQNSNQDSTRNCLNVTLYSIRNIFQQNNSSIELIQFKDECYFINPEIEIDIDVEAFKRYWRVAQSIEREKGIEAAVCQYELAAALYKGDFLENSIYSAWTDLERENLKEIYLYILNKLSDYYSLDGKPDVAINLCNTILEKDNCREDVYRRLMKCYLRIGQRNTALKQYHKCLEILKSELEVEPTRSTKQLYEQIRQDSLKNESISKNQ